MDASFLSLTEASRALAEGKTTSAELTDQMIARIEQHASLGAFLAVEFMRQGKTPEEALMLVMKRVIAMSEKRLLDDKGRPYFDLDFYAVTKDGRVAGACAYEGSSFATCDEKGPRLIKSAYLFKASERPKPRS